MLPIINLEVADEDDVGDLHQLINEAYRGYGGWTRETEIIEGARSSTEDVRNLISNPNTHLLVARINGSIASCICVEEKNGQAYIGTFSVSPIYQNKGIGKQVLSLAENYAVNQLGYKKIMLVVISQREELISFYERRGYQKTGEITDYPLHLNVGVPKVENLTIEYLEKIV